MEAVIFSTVEHNSWLLCFIVKLVTYPTFAIDFLVTIKIITSFPYLKTALVLFLGYIRVSWILILNMVFLNWLQTVLFILLDYFIRNLLFSLIMIYCLRISSLNSLYNWSVTLRYYYNMRLSCVIIEASSAVPTSGAYSNNKNYEPDGAPHLTILPKYTSVGNFICNLMLQSQWHCSGMIDKKHSD